MIDFTKKGTWESLNLLWNEQPAIIEIEEDKPNVVSLLRDDKE